MKLDELLEEKQNPTGNFYISPGTRCHIIGAQNGCFPAFGHHVKNEMGGVWMHPIKLLDGFWTGFKTNRNPFAWLKQADIFCNHPHYNEFVYNLNGIKITRRQFVPEKRAGAIVEYVFRNCLSESVKLDGEFVAVADVSPCWYSENGGIIDGEDYGEVLVDGNIAVKDSGNDWFALMNLAGSECGIEIGKGIKAYEDTYGHGIGAKMNFGFALEAEASHVITFRVAGSTTSLQDACDTMTAIMDTEKLLCEKAVRYQCILDTARIDIPDMELVKQHNWVKCHIEWLTTYVDGIGGGLTAGSPEYPWWFGCDSVYALYGCVPSGFHQLAKDTLDTLAEISFAKNGNGRIAHEINTYGIVANPGNTQETAHYACCVYKVYCWTGDKAWLKKHYRYVKLGLKWLLTDMDRDGDLFPEGYGIMEVFGLDGELIDTAVYTACALNCAAEMANIFGEEDQATEYTKLGKTLEEKIQSMMWLEDEGLYADIRISSNELFPRIDKFTEQILAGKENRHLVPYFEGMKAKLMENDLSDEKSPWGFIKNWVIATPMEMGIAPLGRAMRSLQRLNSSEFIGEYGMFLSGMEQSRIMTISTGVLINANLRYNMADQAYRLIKTVMKTFGMYLPGSISEMSPDYGCFTQAWTSYAMLSPVITGFLGISPDAGMKKVHIAPNLPVDWDYASAKKLKIGNNELDIMVERRDNTYSIKVTSVEAGWHFSCDDAWCTLSVQAGLDL